MNSERTRLTRTDYYEWMTTEQGRWGQRNTEEQKKNNFDQNTEIWMNKEKKIDIIEIQMNNERTNLITTKQFEWTTQEQDWDE